MIGRTSRQALQREAYSDRNETLFLLGFKTYAAYLRSRLWKIVRQRALDIHGPTCRRCGDPATQAHHASYLREVLIGEDVRGLVPVCASCHKGASVTRRGQQPRKDGLKVHHLHDTNAKLAKKLYPREPGDPRLSWCSCGRLRKKNKTMCRACDPNRGVKKRRHKGDRGVYRHRLGWLRSSSKPTVG